MLEQLKWMVCVAVLTATAALLAPSAARAQIYTYQTADGEVLITTEPRKGLKLLDVTEGGARIEAVHGSGTKSDTKRASNTAGQSTRPAAQNASSNTSRPAARRASFSQRENAYDDIIREAAEMFDVPFGFVKAVIRVESGFQPEVVSHAGAMGLMQLMPRTAASLNVTDAFDPRQNIFGGTKFLRILTDRYDGDINLILAAYNAGDVAVRRYDGIPYAKTRQYVASVYHWYQVYSQQAEENE